jgi:hypothetical protein
MMRETTIWELSEDGLSRREWTFWFDERSFELVLDGYTELRRQTARHKFRPFAEYERISRGRSYREAGKSLELKDVPFDEDRRADALRAFVSQIRVVLETERRK